MDTSSVRDGLLNIILVTRVAGASVDLVNDLLSIEQSGSLFQTTALGFNDEYVTEDPFKGEPAAVDDL